AAAFLVDRDFHVVDAEVIEGHRLAEGAVPLDERIHRLLQLLLDESAHSEHLVANALEVLVEAAGDVMRQIGGFHRSPPRRAGDGEARWRAAAGPAGIWSIIPARRRP